MKFSLCLLIFLAIISITKCHDANMIAPIKWKTPTKSLVGDRTVMNFTTNFGYRIKHCQISFGSRDCTANYTKGNFLKKKNCDKIFDDVILNRTKDGKTCQVIIENTQLKHGGLWKCGLKSSLKKDFVQHEEFHLEVQIFDGDAKMWIVTFVEIGVILMGSLSFACLKCFEDKPTAKIDQKKKPKLHLKTMTMKVLMDKDSGIDSPSDTNVSHF